MTTTNLTETQIDTGLLDTSSVSGPVWPGTSITFSIPGAGSTWDPAYNDPAVFGTGEPFDPKYHTMSSAQAANYEKAAAIWDSYIAPSIVKVDDDATSQGEIRVAFTDVAARTHDNSYAYTGAPPNQSSTATPVAGDVWIDASHEGESFDQGTFAFQTLLHETGHALGLKHPFSSPALATGPNGENYNNYAYTLMSYSPADYRVVFDYNSQNGGWNLYSTGQINDSTPMVLDIKAVQDLYGADTTTHAGNDTYTFTDADFETRQSLYDAGGTDTLDFSQISRGSHIDLRPGATSDIDYYSVGDQAASIYAKIGFNQGVDNYLKNNPTYQWTNNFGIAFSTVIENVIGTAHADTIIGNTAANVITGGAGADTITGGGGNDVFKDKAANLNGDRVTDFTQGDIINVTDAVGALVGLAYDDGVLSYALASDPTKIYSMTLDGASGSVHQKADANGGVDIYFTDDDEAVACYCTGTLILTKTGEVAVERLAIGDIVMTASGSHRPVKWIGHREIDITRHPNPRSVWPVCMMAGAVGEGKPAQDLWISPGHNICIDGSLIGAVRLINGRTIFQQERSNVEYWHVELDGHDVLIANGMPAESYIDTGNRSAFENGGAFIELHPDFQPSHGEATCLPVVVEGNRLQAAKAAILLQAESFGHMTTVDSDAHLIADGRRLDAIPLGDRRFAFVIPGKCSDLRLISRTFIPAHVRVDSTDTRSLGLCIKRIQIDGDDIALDHPTFRQGWSHLERPAGQPDQRWTEGDTTLPSNSRLILIELAGHGYYWTSPTRSLVSLVA